MQTRLLCLLLSAVAAFAQSPIANPDFEQGEIGAVPPGWFVPTATMGFKANVVDTGCRTGRCVQIHGLENPPQNMFANLMQNVPAASLVRHRVRLRAAIRVEGSSTRAQMWLRLDRADKSMAFLDNMGQRPITSSQWNTYDIEADVASDISSIAVGVMLFGPGSAFVDDVTLEPIGEVREDKIEPARPLTSRGLLNLTAFTRLYGYVRFFHPSDQAAKTDWDDFAIQGIRTVESAATDTELIASLQKLFAPIAPTVQIYATGKPPAAAPEQKGPDIVHYKHMGVGLPSSTMGRGIYRSERETKAVGPEGLPKPYTAELVPGLSATVPLALYSEAKRTLPQIALPEDVPPITRSPLDRGARLAAVVIAWNVFQHFYPYFDVVKTDWPAELSKALNAAATDSTIDAFYVTLRQLVAALKDGHGNVRSPRMVSMLQPAVTLDWIENQLIVTRVQKDKAEGVNPGDRVMAIDGKPAEKLMADARALISGATEGWIRSRAVAEVSMCSMQTKRMSLTVEALSTPGVTRTVDVPCGPPRFKDMATYTEPRPQKITELEPGIFYVDLDRVDDNDWKTVVPQLAKARGILFDMRGYPSRPGILSLAHLTEKTIRCARWNVPTPTNPDRLDMTFAESGWDVPPMAPYFTAPRAFLIDGRAISYAETVMGIVENYKLGEIVGEPTAGTNGNVNPFQLPGGWGITWTGMKVLKHDKSQHHGIGILPTVPVSRTRKGVAEGKDEILLRGLEVVKAKIQ